MMNPASPSPTPVRLPLELRKWLHHAAIENHRSLSGEIVHRLEQSRAQQSAIHQPAPLKGTL